VRLVGRRDEEGEEVGATGVGLVGGSAEAGEHVRRTGWCGGIEDWDGKRHIAPGMGVGGWGAAITPRMGQRANGSA
jgi:hypothetical protein